MCLLAVDIEASFVLLCFVLDVFLCDPVFEDNGPDKRSITGNQRP
jgi:hypothetical protein